MKKNEGKYDPTLLYKSFKEQVARQRAYGIQKHGSEDGWKTTTTIEHLAAASRHIDETIEAVRNEQWERLTDTESGQLHIAAAVCNLMFEIERIVSTGSVNTKNGSASLSQEPCALSSIKKIIGGIKKILVGRRE